MRLTDRPRTLAETRPDVAWPAELQATIDKALQRDADDRYASAAQFGREFAAAIAAMPATKAAEAGTLVMGAAGAAPTAAIPQMPPTRVARASAGTEQMAAPAAPARPAAPRPAPDRAPAKSSSLVPVLGGVGGLAVVGVVVWLTLFKPDAGDRQGTIGTEATPPSATVDSSTLSAAPAGGGTDTAQRQTEPQPQPVETLNRPERSGPTVPAGGGGGAATPPKPSTAVLLAGWIRDLEDGPLNEAESRRVLNEIDPIFATLQGDQLADGWYVKMQALAGLEDDGACPAARQVVLRHPNAGRRGTAQRFIDSVGCP